MKRVCFLLRVKKDRVDDYLRAHDVWPEVRDATAHRFIVDRWTYAMEARHNWNVNTVFLDGHYAPWRHQGVASCAIGNSPYN